MKVSELIEILKELPQDYEITAVTQDGGVYSVSEVYNYGEPYKQVELS